MFKIFIAFLRPLAKLIQGPNSELYGIVSTSNLDSLSGGTSQSNFQSKQNSDSMGGYGSGSSSSFRFLFNSSSGNKLFLQ